MAENIVKNRFYRILSDTSNQIWDRISFWNTAEDTQANDGESLETKVGAINGITDDLSCEDETIAASAKAVGDSLTWKLALNKTNVGKTKYTLPSDYNELLVFVLLKGGTDNPIGCINIPKTYLTSEEKRFGFFCNVSSQGSVRGGSVNISLTSIHLSNAFLTGNQDDVSSTSILTVYYR